MKEKRWANEERIEEIGLRVSAKFVAIISTEILCTPEMNMQELTGEYLVRA